VPRSGIIRANWVTNEELGLVGSLAEEWQAYRRVIISSDIQLQTRPDVLKWIGGDTSGRIIVKNAYEAIEKKKYAFFIGGW
jgi:hypothetical protein